MTRLFKKLALLIPSFSLMAATCSPPADAQVAVLRWIDVRSHNWTLLWNQAARWNRAVGVWAFWLADGYGTELYPHPGPFSYNQHCHSYTPDFLVNGCVDHNRDIQYRTDRDVFYEVDLVLHELGHTEGPGWHHWGRGVMAHRDAEPTNCITMDDIDWLCDYWEDRGKFWCGVAVPEC